MDFSTQRVSVHHGPWSQSMEDGPFPWSNFLKRKQITKPFGPSQGRQYGPRRMTMHQKVNVFFFNICPKREIWRKTKSSWTILLFSVFFILSHPRTISFIYFYYNNISLSWALEFSKPPLLESQWWGPNSKRWLCSFDSRMVSLYASLEVWNSNESSVCSVWNSIDPLFVGSYNIPICSTMGTTRYNFIRWFDDYESKNWYHCYRLKKTKYRRLLAAWALFCLLVN